MGVYINPGNELFRAIRQNEYVDKSGLIKEINDTIETNRRLTCVCRPRRFGKSYAARMLSSYYDISCDSAELFDDLAIANDPDFNKDYRKYMNVFNVLYLDISNIVGKAGAEHTVDFISENVSEEAVKIFPDVEKKGSLDDTLAAVVENTGVKFIAIIDEWDVLLRDGAVTEDVKRGFLGFMRSLFKSSSLTDKVFAAAYMTGILPIRKDGSQSAISEFKEYSVLKPGKFAGYIGFSSKEVEALSKKYGIDYSLMKRWYDGYSFGNIKEIYNPNSVMEALYNKSIESYWSATSSAESLIDLINLDYDGLQDVVVSLLAGKEERIRTSYFRNDISSLASKDDVLTMLVHFGYFSYDVDTEMIRIPNEEIRAEFADAVQMIKHTDTLRRVKESRELMEATVSGEAGKVAEAIEKVHREETSPLFYNDEQALRSVIKLAYLAYRDEYLQFEELPSGEGFVDILYLPKKGSKYPILVVELKFKDSAESAIAQIRDKKYPEAVKNHGADILLVGISYDIRSKKHECRIEKYERE